MNVRLDVTAWDMKWLQRDQRWWAELLVECMSEVSECSNISCRWATEKFNSCAVRKWMRNFAYKECSAVAERNIFCSTRHCYISGLHYIDIVCHPRCSTAKSGPHSAFNAYRDFVIKDTTALFLAAVTEHLGFHHVTGKSSINKKWSWSSIAFPVMHDKLLSHISTIHTSRTSWQAVKQMFTLFWILQMTWWSYNKNVKKKFILCHSKQSETCIKYACIPHSLLKILEHCLEFYQYKWRIFRNVDTELYEHKKNELLQH